LIKRVFKISILGYFTKSIEESMKEEIGLSFSGGEDFFSADGDDDYDDSFDDNEDDDMTPGRREWAILFKNSL
jgi:hypothetical protein